jgi:hypothetical protein
MSKVPVLDLKFPARRDNDLGEKSVSDEKSRPVKIRDMRKTLPPPHRLPPPPPPPPEPVSVPMSHMTIRKKLRRKGVRRSRLGDSDSTLGDSDSTLGDSNSTTSVPLSRQNRDDINELLRNRIATAREQRRLKTNIPRENIDTIDERRDIIPATATAIKLTSTTSTKSPKPKSGFLSRLVRLGSDINKRFYPKTKKGGRSRQRKGRKTQKRRRRKTQKRRKNYNNYF